eukprot:5574592-Alexandrium_andersonii.AAC.1
MPVAAACPESSDSKLSSPELTSSASSVASAMAAVSGFLLRQGGIAAGAVAATVASAAGADT